MKAAFIVLLLSITSLTAADSLVEPIAVIAEEGSLNISDGSSLYTFNRDGTFSSIPLGISGRTIEGRWTQEGETFIVEGKWSWLNGISPTNDQRVMRLGVGELDKSHQVIVGVPLRKIPVYNCYFVIEELTKKHS